MSFLRSPFSFKKTSIRKHVSRSPLKLPAEEMSRELGPRCEVIDLNIADRKIVFDFDSGDWNTGGAERVGGTASSSTANKTRKQVDILQEENNMLKLKVEVLLNLVAETIAEFSTTEK